MCLLIVKPAGVSIPLDFLKNGEEANPHGAGLVYSDGEKLVTYKGPEMGHKELHSILRHRKEFPAIIHFRFSTCPLVDFANQHPFEVNKDWAMAHNGVIDIDYPPDESDTRAYIDRYLRDFDVDFSDKRVLNIIGQHIGSYNKFAFIHKSGEIGIANEESGHWKDGAWYSNYGYKSWQPSRPAYWWDSEEQQLVYGAERYIYDV